ncbi:DUF1007 family protein [Nisaea sp.]|uniref:DUF1007 family protein n=1 Tax=Nisaea sp. TaxID=2024842 RepID=UPI0032665FA7
MFDLSTRRFHTKLVGLLAAFFLIALTERTANAHPHAWIDASIQVLFDGAGDVYGLRQYWLLDEFYTAFALDSYRTEGTSPSQSEIDDLMRENMKNLSEYTYFTRVFHDGKEIKLGSIAEMASTLRGSRLEMEFVIPLAEAINLDGKPISYKIYDPTYYIEVLHAQSDDAISLIEAPVGCDYRLIAPKPTLEAIVSAANLDRTQSGDDGLGDLFAERVEVSC